MKALVAAFALVSCSGVLAAQCTTGWQPGFSPIAGASHQVSASHLWDRDGAGPLPPVLVVAGRFAQVAGTGAAAIAMQDPGTGAWSSPGGGMTGASMGVTSVRALATLPNGDLVAAGNFLFAGGVPALRIARWNGTAWAPLGTGIGGGGGVTWDVRALAVQPNGDLVAGGFFETAGGVPVTNIARWDGTSWSPMGLGLGPFPRAVEALAVSPSGDLFAGGNFQVSGGVAVNHVARWNGSTWSDLGGSPGASVQALVVEPNGDVIAAGWGNGLVPNQYLLRRWNGAAWATVGSFDSGITSLCRLPNGDLVAGGLFTRELSGPTGSPGIARWNGVAWSGLGTGLAGQAAFPLSVAPSTMLALPNGELLVGGYFATAGGIPTPNLTRWNGTVWQAEGDVGFDAPVLAAARTPNGDVIVTGSFTHAAGGVPARGVARWDGAGWSSFGNGPVPTGAVPPVRAVTVLSNGDIIVGGSFTVAGGAVADHVARWDGSAWVPLAAGVDGTVHALVTLPNGDVVAGGEFTNQGNRLARWDGTVWSPLGSGTDFWVFCLAVAPNGDLIAGGQFSFAGGVAANKVARWDGSAWAPLTNTMSPAAIVYCLQFLANGDLIVGGALGISSPVVSTGVVRWDGAAWHGVGGGTNAPVRAMTTLPDGDLLVGGSFSGAGGVTALRVARWNGTTWSAAGAMDGEVLALTTDAGGVPVAGGAFLSPAPGVASTYLARMVTDCPALVASFAPGCPSSGGANSLVATTLPWVDSTFVAVAQGLPTTAVAIAVTSVTPVVPGFPLATLWPQAPSGCDLHVVPDIIGFLATVTGSVRSELFLPNVPPLVGVTFYHQLLPFDAAGPITATNALQLTAGNL